MGFRKKIFITIVSIVLIIIIVTYATNIVINRDYYRIKSVVVNAIKEYTKTSCLIVTNIKLIGYNNSLVYKVTVVFPEYCFYEIGLEQNNTNWIVVYFGKDI